MASISLGQHRERAGQQGHTTTAAAIEVALQHPVFSTDQQLFCSVAKICRAWREAVQVSDTGTLEVSLQFSEYPGAALDCSAADAQPAGLKALSSFAAWLLKHAGVVRSISITRSDPDTDSDSTPGWQTHLASQLLGHTMGCAAATVRSAVASQQPKKPLRLRSFSSDVLPGSAVLQMLPGGSLTCLDLSENNMAALATVLPAMSNLQVLKIRAADNDSNIDVCMPAMDDLSKLTMLALENVSNFDTVKLPVQLQELVLDMDEILKADFSHLQNLRRLVFDVWEEVSMSSTLPGQLEEMDFSMPTDDCAVLVLRVTSLTNLQRLTIRDSQETPQDLAVVGALPQLAHLELSYSDWDAAVTAAPAWAGLRQLRVLSCVEGRDMSVSVANLMSVLNNVAGLTGLTALSVEVTSLEAVDNAAIGLPVKVCRHMANLPNLHELSLILGPKEGVDLATGDVQNLSSLTKLTQLTLYPAKEFVRDRAVIVLAVSLRQLRSLLVPVTNSLVVAAMRGLTDLTNLQVLGLPALQQQAAFQHLSCLKHLAQLAGFESCSK